MSWRKVKLGEIVENFSVKAKELDDYSDLPFCGVSNQEGITVSKYAAEDKIEDYKIIEKGCFAYNPYRVNVGSIALLDEDRRGLISPAYVVFKTKSETIIDELLLKFLKSGEGLRQIRLHARGTVRQALRFEDLCQIELSIPNFEEQNKLFGKLDIQQRFANNLTTELNQQLTLVKELRQSFLREAMQGKLVEQDYTNESAETLLEKIKVEKEELVAEKKIKKDKPLPKIKAEEIPYEIPTNWTWIRLGSICNLITSGSRDWAKFYSNEGAIFVRMGNLSRNSFNLRMSKIQYVNPPKNSEGNRTRLEENDVLVSITGEVGNLGLIPNDFGEAYINQHTALVRLNNKIAPKYIAYSFLSKLLQEQFNAPQRGLKNSFRLSDIDFLIVPLPPLAEQKRIVEKLERLMTFCDELETNIRESKQQAESLLQVALKEALEPKEEYESIAV